MNELKTIKLYGHLGKKFGKSFQLAVSTPAEAVRALSINLKGFKNYLKQYNFHVFLDKMDIGSEELSSITSVNIIKIVPVTLGSGGIFKIAIGAVMMWYGYDNGGMTSAWFSAGASMVLSGVAEILFTPPRPKSTSNEKPENTPSYIFNGPINTTGSGNPVSLCYGKVRVGSQVISAGLTSREIPI
jgi:predicted phage tail protein